MKNWLRTTLHVALGIAVALSSTFLRSSAAAQEPQPVELLPPATFVGALDLSCHKVMGGETPVRSVRLTHLNPVLRRMGILDEPTSLNELQQLCVPVAKNGVLPPPEVRPYVENVDLACYRADSLEPRPVFHLKMSQLNPVLRRLGLPDHEIAVGRLQQLCVPVAKNLRIPPATVLWLVQHLDVACYQIEKADPLPSYPLRLSHLNPVLRAVPVPDLPIAIQRPDQLCVPVAKNGILPPPEVRRIVQWVDFERFEVISPVVTRPLPLTLSHLNPQFAQFRPFRISMEQVTHLDVPVAKNGLFPPVISPLP